MRRIRYLDQARVEQVEAASYYESQSRGLGVRFAEALREAVARIEMDPMLYPEAGSGTRRCLTRMFPFGVIYRAHGDEIVIIAVAHLKRKPGYWRGRK